jgi:hypothetical protein
LEQNKNYATVSEFQARNSEPAMPIQLYLKTREFDPESVRVMGIAFECARAALHISTDDSMTEAVATRIIELARAGERDSDKLCDFAITALTSPPPIAREDSGQ